MTGFFPPHPLYVCFRANFLAIFVPGRGKWLHLVCVTATVFIRLKCVWRPILLLLSKWELTICENGFAMHIIHLRRVSSHQLSQLFLRTLSLFYSVLWQMLPNAVVVIIVLVTALFTWKSHLLFKLWQEIQWISHFCKCFWNELFASLRANWRTTFSFSYCRSRPFPLP